VQPARYAKTETEGGYSELQNTDQIGK